MKVMQVCPISAPGLPTTTSSAILWLIMVTPADRCLLSWEFTCQPWWNQASSLKGTSVRCVFPIMHPPEVSFHEIDFLWEVVCVFSECFVQRHSILQWVCSLRLIMLADLMKISTMWAGRWLGYVSCDNQATRKLRNSFTYLLTYSMEQSPSWEANRFSASQEIPQILWKPKSLPHSHVPATWPYPKPARSSPYPHIPLPEDPS